jgi:hypothetical protein
MLTTERPEALPVVLERSAQASGPAAGLWRLARRRPGPGAGPLGTVGPGAGARPRRVASWRDRPRHGAAQPSGSLAHASLARWSAQPAGPGASFPFFFSAFAFFLFAFLLVCLDGATK